MYRRAADWVWPEIGFRRAWRYLYIRVQRIPGSPHNIACGLACGAAMSFTPFVGFHFVLSAIVAWILRGNILASAFGTAVGNPWTFPFIWLGIYKMGGILLDPDALEPLPERLSISYIFDHPLHVLLPMTVGCIPFVVASWLIVYGVGRIAVAKYHRARHRRRIAQKHRQHGTQVSNVKGDEKP